MRRNVSWAVIATVLVGLATNCPGSEDGSDGRKPPRKRLTSDPRIQLPSSELARPPEAPLEDAITLELTSSGIVLFAGREVKADELPALLKHEHELLNRKKAVSAKDRTVVIRADRKARVGQVQELIRLCQELGLEKFSLCARLQKGSDTFEGKAPQRSAEFLEEELLELEEVEEIETMPVEEMGVIEIQPEQAPPNDLLQEIRRASGNVPPARRLTIGRASHRTEMAVGSALKWLADHQMPDGSWSFDHTLCPNCKGKCRNPGSLAEGRNAATGLALLSLLGAGQTHKEGKYRNQVEAGLDYLISHAKTTDHGISFHETGGTMYSHGICTIALCEAYAMTADKALMSPAQKAVDYIRYAQDPVGGGWRYMPRQAGDTSVTGWQLAALRSAHMAYLHVPPTIFKGASRFLDSVQASEGANYGYTTPGMRQGTTAIGLLCRMRLGWKKDNPALKRGVEQIAEAGPSNVDVYYNYYATQLLHHWVGGTHGEGDELGKWNTQIRKRLADSQAAEGHETGSWFFAPGDAGAARGGRLYCTAMATMILEVYYRHLPIYRKDAVAEDLLAD